MNRKLKIVIGASVWGTILCVFFVAILASIPKNEPISLRPSEDGLLMNDDLVAIKESDGNLTIKNTETGEVTAEKIKFDWTSSSPNDSLGVFCSKGKRGYYNSYTGKIVVEAQYRRAWIFSEGLAAVQKNGHIGFINRKGETVIPFHFPYHGNPLSEFVFKDGHCVVADTTGKCGVIDREGKWLIKPLYDNISIYEDHAIVSKAGSRMQVDYDGRVLNAFVLDAIEALTYTEQERFENREGEIEYISKTIKTGLFAYRVGGRWGLMDSNCNRLTEPLYSNIAAVDKNMFRATLLDRYSEVILNSRGIVMR